MEKETWIESRANSKLIEPIAVVGSPGLRSIGKLVMDSLITKTESTLIAELYSTHMPSIYQTKPSYAANPMLPGIGGVIVESGQVDFPKVQFYASSTPSLIITKGYHANFEGQYEVAINVLDFLAENHVRKIIVVAGYGSKDKKICCAATSKELLVEMKEKYNIDIGYKGPFMGFSGLVFGLSKQKGMEALCLFSATEPKENDLEFPDNEASNRVLDSLEKILMPIHNVKE
jgi:proteasome assembly chaperone (PAC2) family protein